MRGMRTPGRKWIAAGVTAILVLAALLGLHHGGAAQSPPALSLDSPVSFPVDI